MSFQIAKNWSADTQSYALWIEIEHTLQELMVPVLEKGMQLGTVTLLDGNLSSCERP